METYDLLLKKDSGELRFKRLATNDISGIVDLFRDHDLLDDVSSMYFILIVNQSDDAPEVKMRNSFKLVGDSLEFCDILKEGDIIWHYINSLTKEIKLNVSSGSYETAVKLKETLRIVEKMSAEYDFADNSENEENSEIFFAEQVKTIIAKRFGTYQKITSNDWAGVECYWKVKKELYLIFTDESSVELIIKRFNTDIEDYETTEILGVANNFIELDNLFEIIDDLDEKNWNNETEEYYGTIKIQLNSASAIDYLVESIETGMEFEEGEYFEILDQNDGINYGEYIIDFKLVCKSGVDEYLQESIETGMEFEEGESLEIEWKDLIDSEIETELPEGLTEYYGTIKIQLNSDSAIDYLVESIETGMEFEEGEYFEILDQNDGTNYAEYIIDFKLVCKSGADEYLEDSIRTGMEFEEGESLEIEWNDSDEKF